MSLIAAARESFTAFCAAIGVQLYPWQQEAADGLRREGGHFVYPVVGWSAPRGDGKSFLEMLVGVWRLLVGKPPQDIISAALDADGARVVMNHARMLLSRNPTLAQGIDVRATGLVVPATGSQWTITSREHTASRGRHPNVVRLRAACRRVDVGCGHETVGRVHPQVLVLARELVGQQDPPLSRDVIGADARGLVRAVPVPVNLRVAAFG